MMMLRSQITPSWRIVCVSVTFASYAHGIHTPVLGATAWAFFAYLRDVLSNSRKSAHIDARYHRLRHEVVNKRTIRFVYCPTGDQAADALTKPLPAPAVRRFQLAMSGSVPLPLPDLDGPPGRVGRSLERPDEFPKLTSV